MNLSSITLIITDDCNFSCKYCYKAKSKKYMDNSIVYKALSLLPKLKKNYYINFYGGEPLLSFDLIRETTSLLSKKNQEFGKKCKYTITTNGSLITEDISKFLNDNKFSVNFSFDGLAQDVLRKEGSFKKIVSSIDRLLNYSNIDLSINSVFTPRTVKYIPETINFIISLGVSSIHFSLSTIEPWNRFSLQKLDGIMSKLRKIILSHYKRSGNIPVTNFRKENNKGIFYCSAGSDRVAVSPEGQIWGCFLFAEYFKSKENSQDYEQFYFGDLDSFTKNYEKIFPQISSKYAQLSMDNFSTPNMKCLFCSELENCTVCPINAAFSGNPLGKIPTYICEIQKIKIRQRKRLEEELNNILCH